MQWKFQWGEMPITLEVEPEGENWRVRLPDGSEHRIAATRLPGDVLQIVRHDPSSPENSEQILRIPFAHTDRGVEISHQGETFLFVPAQAQKTRRDTRSASGALAAPMVGVVADVLVREGETVAAFQPLVIVEAMKVMATIEAPFAGVVGKLYVQKGARVDHGAPLVDVVATAPTT